jgi:hypothetical protein
LFKAPGNPLWATALWPKEDSGETIREMEKSSNQPAEASELAGKQQI